MICIALGGSAGLKQVYVCNKNMRSGVSLCVLVVKCSSIGWVFC